MTTLTDRPSDVAGGETARLRRRLRAMTVTVVVLAVALIGLGAWVVYDLVAQPDTAPTAEIEALLDDYTTAWNEYDGDAFLALVTDDYVHEYAGFGSTAESVAADIESNEVFENTVEKVGDPIMIGEGPRYYVAQANRLTSVGGVRLEGISLFTIIQEGDMFKIQEHVFIGE
jgi:hypothetical protein